MAEPVVTWNFGQTSLNIKTTVNTVSKMLNNLKTHTYEVKLGLSE